MKEKDGGVLLHSPRLKKWEGNTPVYRHLSFQREALVNVRGLRLIGHDIRLDLLEQPRAPHNDAPPGAP
jgi:hypothetical protein